jgi:hypothetical protein
MPLFAQRLSSARRASLELARQAPPCVVFVLLSSISLLLLRSLICKAFSCNLCCETVQAAGLLLHSSLLAVLQPIGQPRQRWPALKRTPGVQATSARTG